MNKKAFIDEIILKSKMGDKEQFEKLRKMFSGLCNKLYKDSSKKFKAVGDNKFIVYHDYYIAFWKAINEYDFKTENFGTLLIRECTKVILKVINKDESDNNIRIVSNLGRRSKNIKNRRYALQILKRVTPKQREMLFWNIYRGYNIDKCMKVIGICKTVAELRLRYGFARARKYVLKKQFKTKSAERTLKIREVKI